MKILLLVYTKRRKLSMHLEKQLKAAIFFLLAVDSC